MFSIPRALHSLPLPPSVAVVLLALGLLGLGLVVRRWLRSRVAHRRARRALRGEKRAATLLRHHGYRVHDAQLATTYHPRLAGESWPVALRADYLVSRRGKHYIAEVKTGERAPSLGHPPTRRQLLEYSVAFDVDGVLLVDVESGLVQEVEFPRRAVGRLPMSGSTLLLLSALVGLGWLLAKRAGLLRL
jgi:membrane protein implicated in regulation of membrane protease activity